MSSVNINPNPIPSPGPEPEEFKTLLASIGDQSGGRMLHGASIEKDLLSPGGLRLEPFPDPVIVSRRTLESSSIILILNTYYHRSAEEIRVDIPRLFRTLSTIEQRSKSYEDGVSQRGDFEREVAVKVLQHLLTKYPELVVDLLPSMNAESSAAVDLVFRALTLAEISRPELVARALELIDLGTRDDAPEEPTLSVFFYLDEFAPPTPEVLSRLISFSTRFVLKADALPLEYVQLKFTIVAIAEKDPSGIKNLLIESLQSEAGEIRATAMFAAQQVFGTKDKQFLVVAEKLLKDPAETVQLQAISMLEKFGPAVSAASGEQLLEIVQSENLPFALRSAAILALASIGEPRGKVFATLNNFWKIASAAEKEPDFSVPAEGAGEKKIVGVFVLDEACLADASLHISSSPFENSDFADPEGGDIRRFIKPLLVAFARLSNSDPRAARILSEQVKRRSMVLRLGLIDSLKDVSNPALQRQLIDSVLRSQPLDFVVGAAMLQIGAVTKDALVEYGGELEALIAGSGTVEEAKRLGGQLEVVNSVIQRMIRKA